MKDAKDTEYRNVYLEREAGKAQEHRGSLK